MPKPKTIKIVDVEQPQETQPDEQPAEEVTPEVEEVKETPKAKSKARAKKKVIDETITVAKNLVLDFDTKDEPIIKAVGKVERPNCRKTASAKTFKYSHVHTCKAKKEVVEQPVDIEQPPAIETPMVQVQRAVISGRDARLQKRLEHLNN